MERKVEQEQKNNEEFGEEEEDDFLNLEMWKYTTPRCFQREK